jgi:hypothetical protein
MLAAEFNQSRGIAGCFDGIRARRVAGDALSERLRWEKVKITASVSLHHRLQK